MAHGITLQMRYVRRPSPTFVHEVRQVRVGMLGDVVTTSHVNPNKDRTLAGKARVRARRLALRRVPFFKGHGVASANAFNQCYECPCGRGILAALDDFEFMTEVMEHEAEHVAVSA